MAVLSLLSRCFTIANAWEILFVVMLGASGPSATMVVQIAQLYNNKEDRASAINVASTLACVVTLPLMALIAQAVF
jgi:predicted permease